MYLVEISQAFRTLTTVSLTLSPVNLIFMSLNSPVNIKWHNENLSFYSKSKQRDIEESQDLIEIFNAQSFTSNRIM